MGYNNPLDTEDIIANTLMQESARREQYLATSTPQLAQAVGTIHKDYPALPAGVKLAMAKAGMTAQQIDAMYPTIANAQLRESVKEKPKKSWFERNVTDKIKTASRYTFAGMNLPLDFVQGGLAQIFDPNSSVAGWFISTDLGSLIANDEEAGSGFFIGERAKELQAERARRYRGTIGGHAWTIGRGLASTIVDPNSKAFNYMSGALDAATALTVPTVPLAKGAKVALQEAEALGRGGAVVKGAVDVLEQFGRGSTEIRASRVTPDEIEAARQTILVGGQVDFKAANRWFGTKQAQRVIDRTAATDNFAEVWDLWGRKIDPDLALDLAKESDPDLIRVRLMDELGQAQGLTSTKNFRGGNKTYLSLTRRDQFLAKMPLGDKVSRAYAELPKRDINLLQAESPADKTAQLATLDSMLKLSLVDRQTQQGMLNRAAELLRSKSMPGIDEFNKDLEAVVRDAVENAGVDRNIVDAIFDNYKRVRDQAERFNIDENHEVADAGFYQKVVYGPPAPGSDQTFAGAQLASELAKNHFYFPDVRQIRRLTASKPVSWIFVKQGKAGDPNIDALRAAGQLRMPFAMIESFQEEIWRPLITATVGNFVRNTVDSQLMIALSHKPVSSLLRHPWQYVMAMRGDKRFADLFGRGFDEAPSANLLDDAQEAYRQATSNALNATYRDPVVPWQKARRIGHFDVRDKGLSKTTLGGRMSFARGHADEIGKLNADWATRTLASGRYDIDGVIALIKAGDEDATRWFNSMVEYYKGGRKTYNRATKDWGQVKVDLTDDFNLKALLEESQERLTRISGNNRQLLDVIAEGKLAEVVVDSRKVLTQGADIGQRVVYKVGRRNAMGEIVGIDPQTQGYLIRPFAFTKGEATLDLENLLLSPKIFDDPNMPTRVVGEVIDPTTPVNKQMKASFDRLIDMFHGYLYTQPIGKLERSPIFREMYYQWVDKLAVSLDSQSIDDIIADITNKAAAVRKKPTDYIDAKLWQKLQDIQAGKIKNYGTINRAELNAFVSGQVLDDMKMMFYNATERRNATDGFRIISPFFQQQAEFLGRLGRLAFTPVAGGKLGYLPDPNVLRKGQLAVNGLTEADPDQNGRGFVYTDPVTGQWTFTFPASGQITKLLTGVESPINAPVKGISLGLDYRPGLGPMATIAVSKLLPDKPNTDFARNILLPYGERQGFSESFMPSWFRKVVDGIEGREGSTVFMNVYAETMQALAATGNYDTADPNDRDRLFNDARRKAQYLTILRGISQFTGPAAGSLDQAVKAGEIDAYASELAKAFQELKNNDYDTAVPIFLDVFGDDAFVYLANKTKSVTGGLEASKEFGDFERTNEWLFRQYGEIAGYFGPTGTDFDFSVYQRQLSEGARKRLTPEEILESAEQTIAMSYYRTMRANFGTSLNAEERAYMGQYRRALQDRYPGYAKMVFDPQKLPRQIEQLGMAAQSDRLDGNPVAKAVRYYMQLRDQALTEAAARGRSGLSSNDTADLREYLSSYGQALVSQYPEFGRVYDRLLSREIEQ